MSVPYRVLVILAAVLAAGCNPPEPPPVDREHTPPTQGPPSDTTAPSSAAMAPDFTVSMLGGPKVRLKDLAGKPVVVHFWGTWCYWCKKESPILEKIYQTYRSKGVEFVPISVGDEPREVTEYLEKNRLHWPSAVDPKGAIAAKYKVRGYPTTVLVDRSGRIHKIHASMANEAAWVEMMESLLAKH